MNEPTNWSDRVLDLQGDLGLDDEGLALALKTTPDHVAGVRIGQQVPDLDVQAAIVALENRSTLEVAPRLFRRTRHRGGALYLRDLRRSAKLSLAQAAPYFGVGPETVKGWEQKHHPIPPAVNRRLIELGERFERDGSLPPAEVLPVLGDLPLCSFDEVEERLGKLTEMQELYEERLFHLSDRIKVLRFRCLLNTVMSVFASGLMLWLAIKLFGT